MKKVTLVLLFLILLFSCKENNYNSGSNNNFIDVDSTVTEKIDTINQTNSQFDFNVPIEQTNRRQQDVYDPDDYICPECGDEKEEDEELCYYCNEELIKKQKRQKELEEEENEEDEEY